MEQICQHYRAQKIQETADVKQLLAATVVGAVNVTIIATKAVAAVVTLFTTIILDFAITHIKISLMIIVGLRL